MKPDEARETLERHLGKKDYTRFLQNFVNTARRRERLLYWQEKALMAAGLHLSFQECLPVFTLCHVHRLPLFRREVAVLRNVLDVKYSDSFEKAQAEFFPYALVELFGSVTSNEVDQCHECLRQREKYLTRS
jgi:hypothetical protein